jgi:hypothetical protein
VFVIGMAHATANTSVYEPQVKDWLEHRAFWENANRHVRFWAQEVYADPMYTCVPGASTGLRARELNAYVQHFARLAEVGPDTANTAQSYLGRAYVPLMNAAFRSPEGVYGNTQIPLEQMMHFVSQEVYSARAWATSHAYPDGRVGFAWAQYEGSADDQRRLATRMASAIRHAYAEGGGSASGACSPSGAYTWCQCSLAGARFNDAWATFGAW